MNKNTEKINNELPLSGIRIIAIEQYGAGPWGTMILADLGAEIIKIEDSGSGGDVARNVPPYNIKNDSIYFQSFNRNKLSITLDLKHPRHIEILHPLVEKSDAVFNNLRGDLPNKLGLDYESLKHIKPSIVSCSLSAFGRKGKRFNEPGYDYLMQGYAGWMSITGEPGSVPQKSGLSLVDLSAGNMAALGLISAILKAKISGIGCDVDVNLFNNAISHLGYIGAWHLTKGYQPKRFADSSHPSQVPAQILPTKDNWIVVMCAKEKFYQNLVRILGSPDLANDPRFNSFDNRLENREILIPILKRLSRQKTTVEWMKLFKGLVPSAPVNSVNKALKDPQVIEEMIFSVSHPEFGEIKQLKNPIKISNVEIKHERAPKLGEHVEYILKEFLNFSPEQISEFYNEKVI